MIEVCMEFTLKRETFHYAVNFTDRYLSLVPNIKKWKLQLVGVAAMYIASKMEVLFPLQ
jgi:cyclin E